MADEESPSPMAATKCEMRMPLQLSIHVSEEEMQQLAVILHGSVQAANGNEEDALDQTTDCFLTDEFSEQLASACNAVLRACIARPVHQ